MYACVCVHVRGPVSAKGTSPPPLPLFLFVLLFTVYKDSGADRCSVADKRKN